MDSTTDGTRTIRTREFHLRDQWRIAWQGRWTVVSVFIVVVAAVLLYTLLQTPIYQAIATVEIQPQARRLAPIQDVSGIGSAGYGWFAEEKYKNTQTAVIKSRDVARRAFHTLGLANDPRFAEATDPIAAFAGRINVQPRRDTGLIDIRIEGPDGNEVARWANAVAQSYVTRNLDKARDNAQQAIDQIKNLMDPLSSDLEKLETGRLEILRDEEIWNPENQQEIIRQRLVTLNDNLNQTEVRIGALQALLGKIEDILEQGADPLSIPELEQDQVLEEMARERIRLENELETAKITFRQGHRSYQEKLSQLEKVRGEIRAQVNLLYDKYRNELEIALRNKLYLKGEIDKAERVGYEVGKAVSGYEMAQTDTDSMKQIYELVNKTMNEVTLGAQLLANNVTILDEAIPPTAPIRPKKRLNMLIGGMFGLFLGVGLVFFLDYLDHTFRSPEDVERTLGLATLAVIPAFRGGEREKMAVQEAYQTLGTALAFSSLNRERRVVLVTSTVPQEGKSSTVARLGRTLAASGDRVIVLDCDLRKPTQHKHLELPQSPGMSTFLAGPKDASDWSPMVQKVSDNLHAMTSGPIPPNPPELLGSERFKALLIELRERYDWVLVDSPPAVSLADTLILSSVAEMVVLVIRHNETDREVVSKCAQRLRGVGATLPGVVLNNVDVRRALQKDYYAGYYYYHDDGERTGRKRPRGSRVASAGGTGA